MRRNDRTPLNTPYTPQLMKLHLKRHEAYDERDECSDRPGKQLVTTVKSKLKLVLQPVFTIQCVPVLREMLCVCVLRAERTRGGNGYIFCMCVMLSSALVHRAVNIVVPRFILQTALIAKVCFSLALSSRVFCAFADDREHNACVDVQMRPWVVWYFTAVVCVPFVMMLSPLLIAVSVCTSPIWLAGIAVLLARLLIRKHRPVEDRSGHESEEEEREPGGTSPHHPNSVYRRAHLTNSCNQRGYG